MNDPMAAWRATAAGFEPVSPEDRERLLGAIASAQRIIAHIPADLKSFDETGAGELDFLSATAYGVGEARFSALISAANIDGATLRAFEAQAKAAGGIVPLLKSRLRPASTFDLTTGGVVACVSGALLAVGGGALAASGAANEDVPLALFGIGLLGAGVYTCVVYCGT